MTSKTFRFVGQIYPMMMIKKTNIYIKKEHLYSKFGYQIYPTIMPKKINFWGVTLPQFPLDWYNNLPKVLRSNLFVTVVAENAPLPKCQFFDLHSLEEIQKKIMFY